MLFAKVLASITACVPGWRLRAPPWPGAICNHPHTHTHTALCACMCVCVRAVRRGGAQEARKAGVAHPGAIVGEGTALDRGICALAEDENPASLKQQPLLWKLESATKRHGEWQRGVALADASSPSKAVGTNLDKATR